MNKQFLTILACPICRSSVEEAERSLVCSTCHRTYPVHNGIPDFTQIIDEEETKLSLKKFHELYNEGNIKEEKLYDFAKQKIKEYFPLRKLLETLPNKKHGNYLELGIGGSIAINTIAQKGYTIYGIDFSLTSLALTKQIAKLYKIPCFLVCADIAHPPFKENTFDIIYGGGTLEHIEQTQDALCELYKVTRKNGYIINTIPVVSVSSLTYRQFSGNIPEIPLLKPLFYFIHRKIFKTKFMFTGYEKSFLPSTIKKMHKKAGYKQVEVFRYEFTPELPHFSGKLKLLLQKLEKKRLFWTAINVLARKS